MRKHRMKTYLNQEVELRDESVRKRGRSRFIIFILKAAFYCVLNYFDLYKTFRHSVRQVPVYSVNNARLQCKQTLFTV